MKSNLLIILLLFVTASYADNESCIIIKSKSGNETIIELLSNPIITFSEADMLIVSDNAQYQWLLDDIDEYRISQISTGLQNKTVISPRSKEHFVLSGIPKDIPVIVYSIDGKMVKRFVPDESGYIDVYLGELPKGVYIINANKTSFKIINN